MNISAPGTEVNLEDDGNLWILKLVCDIIIYLIGTYLNWKILIVSRKTKDKTWQQDMAHSVSMFIMFWTIVFENVSLHVKALSVSKFEMESLCN